MLNLSVLVDIQWILNIVYVVQRISSFHNNKFNYE